MHTHVALWFWLCSFIVGILSVKALNVTLTPLSNVKSCEPFILEYNIQRAANESLPKIILSIDGNIGLVNVSIDIGSIPYPSFQVTPNFPPGSRFQLRISLSEENEISGGAYDWNEVILEDSGDRSCLLNITTSSSDVSPGDNDSWTFSGNNSEVESCGTAQFRLSQNYTGSLFMQSVSREPELIYNFNFAPSGRVTLLNITVPFGEGTELVLGASIKSPFGVSQTTGGTPSCLINNLWTYNVITSSSTTSTTTSDHSNTTSPNTTATKVLSVNGKRTKVMIGTISSVAGCLSALVFLLMWRQKCQNRQQLKLIASSDAGPDMKNYGVAGVVEPLYLPDQPSPFTPPHNHLSSKRIAAIETGVSPAGNSVTAFVDGLKRALSMNGRILSEAREAVRVQEQQPEHAEDFDTGEQRRHSGSSGPIYHRDGGRVEFPPSYSNAADDENIDHDEQNRDQPAAKSMEASES